MADNEITVPGTQSMRESYLQCIAELAGQIKSEKVLCRIYNYIQVLWRREQ